MALRPTRGRRVPFPINGALAAIVLGILFIATALTLKPFFPAILWAIVLAVTAAPFHHHLVNRMPGRPRLSGSLVSLGLFLMTTAAKFFAERGCGHLYLGSCYADSALYKTQFTGFEFCNSNAWSANLEELKFILKRSQGELSQHLLEDAEYRETFAPAELPALALQSPFQGRV